MTGKEHGIENSEQRTVRGAESPLYLFDIVFI